ncbi:hypothetical protein CAL13_03085 [Bordetella genomosp. 9]|uniref:Uncharacterized protein n=1 Tax=Bordetella genomosp. 9 TaxID=1416803 RepID=A0A1W6YWD5_9BORD|nr:hypothetical protein [Bordetella genomosp. 9]ARP85311.1 hypothetical protein CAL13_03085 [Bordetella genomosp. 9]
MSRPPLPAFTQQTAIEKVRLAENGVVRVRHSSINEHPIAEADRKFHWPLGRRPDDHPGLSHFGF